MCIGAEDGCQDVPDPIAPIDIKFVSLEPTLIFISLFDITSSGPMFIFDSPVFMPGMPPIGVGDDIGIGMLICTCGDGVGVGEGVGEAAGICIMRGVGEGVGVGEVAGIFIPGICCALALVEIVNSATAIANSTQAFLV